MNFLARIVVLALLSFSGVCTREIYYVKPNDSSSLSCPGQPCLALDQYVKETATYFTAGSTFLFLAGNHTGLSALYLTNVSGITLKSNFSSNILCHNGFTIVCENVTRFILKGLDFIYSSKSEGYPKSSALDILNSREVMIIHSTFQGNDGLELSLTRAVNCTRSTIMIISCYFEGNTGDHGGAIHASSGSNITLTNSVFTRNTANISGGAIFAFQYASLFMLNTTFMLNSAVYNGGAVNCKDCSINMTGNNTFKSNRAEVEGGALSMSKGKLTTSGTMLFSQNHAEHGGGMFLSNTSASLNGGLLIFRKNSARFGGALNVRNIRSKPLTVISCAQNLCFTDNEARDSGGAIYVKYSNLILGESLLSNFHFTNNSAGGAIFSRHAHVEVMGGTYYKNNHLKFAERISSAGSGGAIKIQRGNFTLHGYSFFSGNKAFRGGAIQLVNSNASLNGTKTEFEDNLADTGGAIHCEESVMTIHTNQAWFSGNVAKSRGGAIAIIGNKPITVSGIFAHNLANQCGGVFAQKAANITFVDINITNNTGSGLCLFYSQTFIGGTVSIVNNTGIFGGGIHSENSIISLTDNVTLVNNRANFGGGIYSVYGSIFISGVTLFTHNEAKRDGGAMFALGTGIVLNNTINFTFNTAQNGGVIYLKSSANVSLTPEVKLTTSYNDVAEYGGAVYNEDTAMPSQCNFQASNKKDTILLPHCFVRLTEMVREPIPVYSYHDSAGKDGEFLYGGLLDRCRIPIPNSDKSLTKFQFRKIIKFHAEAPAAKSITSQPYQLCFCSGKKHDCSNSKTMEVYRGQKFTVPIVAIDQMGKAVSTSVTAKTSSKTWVFKDQRTQNIGQNCTDTEYNLYSTENYEELILYPEGPCRDLGLARAAINVTFRSCPIGFNQSGGKCVCEYRLQKYHAVCKINAENSITISAEAHFWVGSHYVNGSFEGLILYETCPVEYCKMGNVTISLQDPNGQCDHMHSGVLCGSCDTNYSFLLGSSNCGRCPNDFHLVLLLPFAAAGIGLVVFLSILRLTVATGMINSIILYANIVQINRNNFFPIHEVNTLTVFIAWLNLDLGFETCFYNGLTAYAQIWLQFAFPIYVWVLISLIILTSRYSMTVSKLIGSNPIAVLATLLLMSYTKIVKIMIEVYSFAKLDYPSNVTVIVWLKDGNVPYLDPLQLLLTVASSLVLVFLFLPYTLLLLLSYKLYRFTDLKFLKWLNRIKPLLDCYYAPYKKHTRYWTGFLLLVRCALYATFAFNSHTLTNTAIVITFAAIITLSLISGRIYSKLYTNILEAATLLNLIVLSAATLAGFNSAALVYSLVGIIFVTMVGIMVYHFVHLHIVAVCLKKILLRLTFQHYPLRQNNIGAANTPVDFPNSKHVSTSEICLREPLLDL